MKKKILVTGGSGYVGRRVTRALLERGFFVRVVDKTFYDMPSGAGEFFQGDLRDREFLMKALSGVTAVIHLAADIGSIHYMRDYPGDILAHNASIDAVLYPAVVAAGVKLVVYSSSSMVFEEAEKYPYREIDLPQISPPRNIYGFSKLLGEYFCRAFHTQYKLDYVIVRYHNIYGPGEQGKYGIQNQKPRAKDKYGYIHVLPALLEKVFAGQYPLELLGGIGDTRPFTYIDDAVDATVRLLEEGLQGNKQVLGEDFNIGPSESVEILTLAKILWSMYGDNRPFSYVVKQVKTGTARRREMNPGKIEQAIGWKPKVSLKEGIMRTAEWMKNDGKDV